VPFRVRVTVDYAGRRSQALSPTYDSREEAFAELEKIKKAQEVWTGGTAANPGPFEEAKKELPDWLTVHDVGGIVDPGVWTRVSDTR
jgi:hypothetical protein